MLFIRKFSSQREIVKFYYDFKSPYSFLSLDDTLKLEKDYPIRLRFLPWPFRPEETFGGKLEERKRLHWNKVRYLYADCRRFANERGLIIKGPERLFDSRLSLIAGLYADRQRQFPQFAQRVFEKFFQRKLNLEEIDELLPLFDPRPTRDEFEQFLNNDGAKEFDLIQKEAEIDEIFGVPTFVLRGEKFWGYDRLSWLKKRLDSHRFCQ